jgi:hypothetical protein
LQREPPAFSPFQETIELPNSQSPAIFPPVNSPDTIAFPITEVDRSLNPPETLTFSPFSTPCAKLEQHEMTVPERSPPIYRTPITWTPKNLRENGQQQNRIKTRQDRITD